jgi:hypothetical protein
MLALSSHVVACTIASFKTLVFILLQLNCVQLGLGYLQGEIPTSSFSYDFLYMMILNCYI